MCYCNSCESNKSLLPLGCSLSLSQQSSLCDRTWTSPFLHSAMNHCIIGSFQHLENIYESFSAYLHKSIKIHKQSQFSLFFSYLWSTPAAFFTVHGWFFVCFGKRLIKDQIFGRKHSEASTEYFKFATRKYLLSFNCVQLLSLWKVFCFFFLLCVFGSQTLMVTRRHKNSIYIVYKRKFHVCT